MANSVQIAYLACPYSHPDPCVKASRLQSVTAFAYYLIQQGIYVYSPLTHNFPIDSFGIFGDWETWKIFDHAMMSRCDKLIILRLPRWEASKGVAAEREFAQQLGIPIEEMDFPQECEKLLASNESTSSQAFKDTLNQ